MKKVLLTTLCGVLLSSAASASTFITQSEFLSGDYDSSIAKIVVGGDSVVDLVNGVEMIRVDVMQGQFCHNQAVFGGGNGCNNTESLWAEEAMILNPADGWEWGTGYEVVRMLDTFSRLYYWPGAFGSAPNYNHHRFETVDGVSGYNPTINNFMGEHFGWKGYGTQSNPAPDAGGITIDLFTTGDGAAQTGTGSTLMTFWGNDRPFSDASLRWYTFGDIANSVSTSAATAAPLAVRNFTGDFFSANGEQGAADVPVFGTALLLGLFGMVMGRRKAR